MALSGSLGILANSRSIWHVIENSSECNQRRFVAGLSGVCQHCDSSEFEERILDDLNQLVSTGGPETPQGVLRAFLGGPGT